MKLLDSKKKETYPDWYWKGGIYDATILKREYYDYLLDGILRHNGKTYRNCLRIELDSSGALYENDIIAIEFYNYKELNTEKFIEGFWWYEDYLELQKDKYILHVQLMSNTENNIVRYDVRFSCCKVLRSLK